MSVGVFDGDGCSGGFYGRSFRFEEVRRYVFVLGLDSKYFVI